MAVFLFAAILAGVIYPIVMGWQWGGGWLAELGFSDFAGSTLVHSTGGAAALAGIMLLGARYGRFDSKGEAKAIKPFAASSIPLVTVGVFILWLGWFGFNGGSQLAIGTFTPWSDASAVDTGYADGSDWFFQMVFCATTVSICSGAMAERIKLWPFSYSQLF